MAYLRVYLNNVLLDQIELSQAEVSIGRNPDCDLVIDNAGVSSHHASIRQQDGLYVIVDNNSTNGVFVNGRRITEHTLNYRDEIQLYNYVLKFMATAGLQDEADPDIAKETQINDSKTMEIPISGVTELFKLRNKKKTAYLEVKGSPTGKGKLVIARNRFSIGRSKEADLRTSGWFFAPAIAAEIEKRQDGYYLVPQNRAKARINNRTVTQATKLTDGDHLKVRNLELVFHHRLVNS